MFLLYDDKVGLYVGLYVGYSDLMDCQILNKYSKRFIIKLR